jgi:hypothetical protein
MIRRATLLFGAFLVPAAVVSAAFAFAGCGKTEDVGFTPDATADMDVFTPPPGHEAGPVHEAGTVPEAGAPPASCSPVDSPTCNVVLNDCPPSEAGVPGECLPGNGDASATCTFERPSQHLPAGHTCCPTASRADEPCLTGSECIGDPCIDGGTPTARCSPRCCDDSMCGTSPEGIAGHCALDLVNSEGDSLYQVCTYQRPCKPFHVQPCPSGEVCTIEDHLGTSSCIDTFLPDGGDGSEGSACAASNSCAESLTCLSLGDDDDDAGDDAGDDSDDVFACFYECIVTGFSTPFDASPNAPAGYGGCPAGEVCITLDSTDSPPWLGYCGAP